MSKSGAVCLLMQIVGQLHTVLPRQESVVDEELLPRINFDCIIHFHTISLFCANSGTLPLVPRRGKGHLLTSTAKSRRSAAQFDNNEWPSTLLYEHISALRTAFFWNHHYLYVNVLTGVFYRRVRRWRR